MNTIKGLIPNLFLFLGAGLNYLGIKVGSFGITLHKLLNTKEGQAFTKLEKETKELVKVLEEIKVKSEEEKLFNGRGGNA